MFRLNLLHVGILLSFKGVKGTGDYCVANETSVIFCQTGCCYLKYDFKKCCEVETASGSDDATTYGIIGGISAVFSVGAIIFFFVCRSRRTMGNQGVVVDAVPANGAAINIHVNQSMTFGGQQHFPLETHNVQVGGDNPPSYEQAFK
ncbi:uncharacterized protein LOC127873603 isoform X4 [Dreissena polymorpha]|uniref:uncharacterized protein LOC127873603 isoform X4 n=1 Tax=Dreissena polymorpha TaxID=45954 RepID=UPI0022644CAD|nr:uncharacterized protein LOC127873603 isoform X4 [Dreissena polymorpha]